MSALALRLIGQRPERRAWLTNPNLSQLLGERARSSAASTMGLAASYDGSKTHSAVYACVDLLCRLICTMPIDQYRATATGKVEMAPSALISAPSPEPWMPAAGWRRQVLEPWMLRGYAAGLVTAERNGWPEQIQMLHPDQVTWRRRGANGVEWRLDGKPVGSWWDGTGPLWVAPSLHATPGSPVGASVLRYAASTISLGLGAQRFGGDWFDNSAHPSGVLGIDADEVNEEQAKQVKARWKQAVANRDVAVISKAATYNAIQIAADESQFLETIKANTGDVCRYFGVPPESIGASSGDSMTYANVEGRNLGLLTNTVGAWIAWLEMTLTMLLPRPQFVKVVPDALLRTSTVTRYTAHEKALRNGFMTQNEVRALEDLEPAVGGDELLWPPFSIGTVTTEAEPGEGLSAESDQQHTEPVEGP